MLIDTFLPDYDFNERHSTRVRTDPDKAYVKMLGTRIATDWIMKILLRVRGISHQDERLTAFGKGVFTKLGERPGEEIVFGIISNDGFFSSCRSCTVEEFMMPDKDVIRSVINFRSDRIGNEVMISTETRILCGNSKLKKSFSRYWFIVKPFSGLLRKRMLRQLKRGMEGDA